MRHQAAARLVHRNHDAMVITVSRDGPVSLFAWVHDDASVVMIKKQVAAKR
jgi:DNA integrity scanning protein DisA with diadenylate cyclase activity